MVSDLKLPFGGWVNSISVSARSVTVARLAVGELPMRSMGVGSGQKRVSAFVRPASIVCLRRRDVVASCACVFRAINEVCLPSMLDRCA